MSFNRLSPFTSVQPSWPCDSARRECSHEFQLALPVHIRASGVAGPPGLPKAMQVMRRHAGMKKPPFDRSQREV